MRTNIRTLVTLDTVVSGPNRNEGRHTTFLELGSSCRPCTVLDALERANREEVTVLTVDRTNDLGDELRLVAVVLSGISRQARPCGIDSQLLILAAAVHSCVVLINDILALLAVGLHDEVLHLLNCLLNRDDFGDTEESRLEDGVGTVAQTDLLRNLSSVDVIHFNLMVSEVFLHFVRQVLNELVSLPDGVQEERTAVLQTAGDIVHLEVRLNVASHEVRRGNEVSGVDRLVAETEVGASETTGFLTIVREVSLAVFVGGVTDDLHRVLVSTYGTIGTQSVELSLEERSVTHRDLLANRQRSEGDIIVDTYGEVVLRLGQSEVLEDSQHLRRSGIVGTQTVASANHEQILQTELEECVAYIEVERFAVSARLFGTVKHADALNRCRQRLLQVLEAERTIEVYVDHTEFLITLGSLVVDDFADSLASRTHTDDDVLCIGSTVVVERTVLAAGDLADLLHIVGNDIRHCVVVTVAALAVSEEDIGVLRHTAHLRTHRAEGTLTELLNSLPINERTEILHIYRLHLLVLVRGTEAVEEVEERYAALDSSEVCYSGEVHYLLYGSLSEHSETGLAASHDILMVTEDTEHVACQRTSRYMEDGRDELTGNLVHVRNHQQQTLRSRESGGERTCVQRTVNSTCGTCLRLHLLHEYGLSEQVLATCGSPLVHVLCHRRRRRDRIDSSYLGEHVSHMRRSCVTIHGHKFFLFCHFIVVLLLFETVCLF